MSRSEDTRTRILEATQTALAAPAHMVSVKRVAELAGVSRQALYLHFASRADLLIAAARHIDESLDLEAHTAPLRQAQSAEELVRRYAEFLSRYNPLIYPVVRAADAMRVGDDEIAAAWSDRLANRRRGAYQTARRLATWRRLRPVWTPRTAADWLTVQASVKVWEELVVDLGYSPRRFVAIMTRAATEALLTPRP